MSDEWGPWIEHDGRGCPCVGKVAWVVVHDGREAETSSAEDRGSWNWIFINGIPKCEGNCEPVIRYRVRRPKALQQLIQMVENLAAPSKQYEDA